MISGSSPSLTNTKILSGISLLIFIVNPFLGVLNLIFFLTFFSKHFFSFNTSIILISSFLSLVNVNKDRSVGDILSVSKDFYSALELNLFDFVLKIFEEPVYSIFVWLSARLFDGNFNLFAFSSTFIFYYFFNGYLVKILRYYGVEKDKIITSIIIFSFFPLIFTWSFHLTRQMLSLIFLMAFFSSYIVKGKTKLSYLILGVLTHTSIVIYSPILLFLVLRNKFSLKVAMIVTSLFSSIIYFFSSYLLGLSTYTSKITNRFEESGLDDGGSLNEVVLYFILLSLGAHLLILLREKKLLTIALLNLYTIIIILVTYKSMPVVGYRLSINFFVTLPFIIILSLKKYNILYRFVNIPISTMLFIWFFYYLENGPWAFGDLNQILSNNIFNNFYGLFS